MPTHPIDAPASRSLIAAFFLIVAFGVLALLVRVEPRNGAAYDDVPAEAVAVFPG